jgi:hypothetical protein
VGELEHLLVADDARAGGRRGRAAGRRCRCPRTSVKIWQRSAPSGRPGRPRSCRCRPGRAS